MVGAGQSMASKRPICSRVSMLPNCSEAFSKPCTSISRTAARVSQNPAIPSAQASLPFLMR